MVRRAAKKGKKNKIEVPVVQKSSAAPGPAAGSGGFSPAKLLLVIAAVLAFLYGPGLFKKRAVFQPPAKYFLVKQVAQFSGDDLQGAPFFANDIAAVGPDELAITDNLGAQVLLCDFKGKLIRKWGKNGGGPKEFREPSGVATDGKGRLFVLDTVNGAIKLFNLSGKAFGVISLDHDASFSTPRRLSFGGDNLLVTNANDARLIRVSPKGKVLSVWGEKGAGQGGIWGASKAILDKKGRYYTGDMNGKDSRVRVFDATGNVVQEIKTGVPPDSLGLDSQGRLFAASYGDNARVFDANGVWLGFLADDARPLETLNQIAGIDILPNGLILTCGGNVITIYKLIEDQGKQP